MYFETWNLPVTFVHERCSYIRARANNVKSIWCLHLVPIIDVAKSNLNSELMFTGLPIQTRWTIAVLYECGDISKSKRNKYRFSRSVSRLIDGLTIFTYLLALLHHDKVTHVDWTALCSM